MAKVKRTKTGQIRHDKAVLSSARSYQSKGYKVNADLPGYSKPQKISGYIPDVIAKKGKKMVVVEVETRSSSSKDVRQQNAFKVFTSKDSKRTFRKRVI